MYGMTLQLMWRKDFLFLSRKLFGLCFWIALLHSKSYFFFLNQSPSLPLCTFFDAISSNIDEVLSVNPPANAFVFALYEEIPPVIQGFRVSPFSLSISQYAEGLNPFSRDTLSLIGHPHILYFFQTSRFWQDSSDKIVPIKYQINTKINSRSKAIFSFLEDLKNNIKCSFINSTFISNTRLRFNVK